MTTIQPSRSETGPFGLEGPPNPVDPAGTLDPFVAEIGPGSIVPIAGDVDVVAAPTTLDLHPDLPSVPAWGYGFGIDITSPGPVLEARADVPVTIRWHNRLPASVRAEDPKQAATLPFATSVLEDPDDKDSVQNHLGGQGGDPEPTSMVPIGWTSVHLHGGHSRADSDGFPDNMAATGGAQRAEYDNSVDNVDVGLTKIGAHQWYHDHAMNGTRHHVFAGLAGGYLVRHPREAELGLPVGPEQGELHLMLADRNLDVAEGDVRLLHKTTKDTAEFFGPLTLVNGRVWPRMSVRPGVFRLRLLNGANARAYRLHLISVDDSGVVYDEAGRMLVIGTDGGLLWRAAKIADGALVLAPSERLDVLLDLSGLESGRSLHLVNTAPAPFQAQPEPDLTHLLTYGARPDRNPYPWVMRFDVDPDNGHAGAPADLIDRVAGEELAPGFRRLVHDAPDPGPDPIGPTPFVIGDDHDHHVILLGETNPPGHLYLQELIEDPFGPVSIQLPDKHVPATFRVDGRMTGDHSPSSGRVTFYDHIALRPPLGRWQVWEFVNTTGDVHPIHIHQSQFQPLGTSAGLLTVIDPGGDNLYDPMFRRTRLPLVPAGTNGRGYEAQETTGWKDVIRLDPGNVVKVAIRFDTPGRYVFHCHVLEHEDTEMMRPFVVPVLPMDDPTVAADMSM